MGGFLTHRQIKAYKYLHKNTKVPKKADRIKAILLLNTGYTYEEIADILLIDEGTVRRWYRIFESDGIKTLLEDN